MSFPLCWFRGRNWLGKLCSEKKREEEKRGREKRFLCLFLFLSLSPPSTSSSNTSRNSSSCSLAPPATTRGGGLFVPLSIDPARPADGSRRQQDASAPGEERPSGSFRIPPARASSDRCAKPSTFPPFGLLHLFGGSCHASRGKNSQGLKGLPEQQLRRT